jgi:transcriptional regulator with XRE-family HTH domain
MKDKPFIFDVLQTRETLMPFDRHRLIMLRKQRGLSQYRLSIETNLEHVHINHLEAGRRKNPGFETVEKLAEFFKVNMETFCSGGALGTPKKRTPRTGPRSDEQ